MHDILIAALSLHRLAPGLPITAIPARLNTPQAMAELGLSASFPSDDLMSHVLARSAQTPHAGPLIWQVVRDEEHRIQELDVAPDEIGRPMNEVRSKRALSGQLVLGILEDNEVRFGLEKEELHAESRLLILRRI